MKQENSFDTPTACRDNSLATRLTLFWYGSSDEPIGITADTWTVLAFLFESCAIKLIDLYIEGTRLSIIRFGID